MRRREVVVSTARRAQAIGPEQTELVDRVLQLAEMPVHCVMVPAGRAISIAATARRGELLRVARATPHARLLVYGAHRRQILGVVQVDDLMSSHDWQTVGERIEPAVTLTHDQTVVSAIAALQGTGREMGIVTQRGGGMLGIVTLRGLLQLVVAGVAGDV
jgi:CBS domain containing-hemolysin-like protein